jgi:16S rRNA (adenine1518-N6/adenine1519-N6)-dimethyltransferase
VKPPGILTPTETRALLARLGHQPRRNLGQNFLVDGNIVRKSLELARLSPGGRVVEIGPGLGTLTAALLAAGAEVFAIESDPAMCRHLREAFAPQAERLHLAEGDAVRHPLGPLPAAAASAFKIVANLPYAISSPWMEAVLAGPLPERMVLMLQLEAAQRYLAQPGSKAFGAIAVFLQAAFTAPSSHRVSRSCFHPAPQVGSVLLDLERRPEPFQFCAAARGLVRALFQHRRKQLAPLLRRLAPAVAERWLPAATAAGVPLTMRAEDVPAALWINLDAAVRSSAPETRTG